MVCCTNDVCGYLSVLYSWDRRMVVFQLVKSLVLSFSSHREDGVLGHNH